MSSPLSSPNSVSIAEFIDSNFLWNGPKMIQPVSAKAKKRNPLQRRNFSKSGKARYIVRVNACRTNAITAVGRDWSSFF